jgi:uncharacterized protein (DUF1697 family)
LSGRPQGTATVSRVYIALFRGVNVGGKNLLPMKGLVRILENLGCRNVRTLIQSGNVVFESPQEDRTLLSGQVATEIAKEFGLAPYLLLLTPEELERAATDNPFPEAESQPSKLHLGFLATPPDKPDLGRMEALRSASERSRLIGKVFYLHAPDGVGRSKLAANAEKLLGVPMTDRNWSTVSKLRGMTQPPA